MAGRLGLHPAVSQEREGTSCSYAKLHTKAGKGVVPIGYVVPAVLGKTIKKISYIYHAFIRREILYADCPCS